MKWILIICLVLLFTPCYAETFSWTHDCLNTTGFRVYYEGSHLVADTLCPNNQVIFNDIWQGRYTVKAYNGNGESPPSDEVLWAGYYYNKVKYDYVDGKLTYKGEHTDQNANDSDPYWIVSRYYYTGNEITEIRVRTTSWTDRATGW